jgi:hypothetical protein
MKSRIKFDLGENNKEIISARIVKDNEDVRDRIASGFKEGFGYESNICLVKIYQPELNETILDIYPVNSMNTSDFVNSLCDAQKVALYSNLCRHIDKDTGLLKPKTPDLPVYPLITPL